MKEEKIKQTIRGFYEILKNYPHKDQVYSIYVKKMSAKTPIDLSEYWKYTEYYHQYEVGYQNYFLEQNKFFIDSINAKMNALEDIDAKNYELFKYLEGFARAHFLEPRDGTWWEKVDLYYEQQNTEYDWIGDKEMWHEFLAQDCGRSLINDAFDADTKEESERLLAQAEKICQKEMAFAKKYFESIHLGEEVDKITGHTIPKPLCFWSDGVKACDYKLKMSLKLTGTLKIIRDYSVGACDTIDVEWIEFEPDSKKLPSFLQYGFNLDLESNMKHYKALEPYIPQWFKDNLAGEIALRAEIEAGDYFRADFSACSFGHSMQVKNMKIIKPIKEKLYGREKYADPIEYDMRIHLTSKDSYVNLRESPNGKILRRIELGDDYLLWNLGESHSQWLKVLYFPPNVDDAKKAVIGYIHKSQIERESLE